MDIAQEGYASQFAASGRDDLGMMRTLGANAVRTYHSLGLESKHNHGQFLDRAHDLGLHTLLGFHTQNVCPDFNCFDSWKAAALTGFKNGLQKGDSYHPAVSMMILHDEPDILNFGGNPPPVCVTGSEGKCRVRAALSALDGLLAAEQEAKISNASLPNLTIAWSFDLKTSIDGKITGEGYFGFQDMIAGTANPKIADYTPVMGKDALLAAFNSRWVHAINTQSDWAFIKEKVQGNYNQFLPKPWFISAFRGDTLAESEIQAQLKEMDAEAANGGAFLGVTMYSFQVDYMQTGAPQTYGIFGLGNQTIGSTEAVYQEDVNTHDATSAQWTVPCLDPKFPRDHRADAVAAAWKGSIKGHGVCSNIAITQAEDLVVV